MDREALVSNIITCYNHILFAWFWSFFDTAIRVRFNIKYDQLMLADAQVSRHIPASLTTDLLDYSPWGIDEGLHGLSATEIFLMQVAV